MKSFLHNFNVHHHRKTLYYGSVIPEHLRLTLKGTLSKESNLNLGNAVPKTIPPLTYSAPTRNRINDYDHVVVKQKNHVNKDSLLNSINRDSLLPLNTLSLTDLKRQLSELPERSRDVMMEFCFRVLPDQKEFQVYEFKISEEVNKMLMYVFTTIGLSRMVPFSTRDLFVNTRSWGGLHHLLEGTNGSFRRVLEFFTFYKGMYGRIILLVSLGVGCTVWYTFLPRISESLPLEIFEPRDLSYSSFGNVDFDLKNFKKASFIEYKYITDQVLSAFENVYPFSEMDLPNINPDEPSTSTSTSNSNANAKVAIGLGIIVAFYIAMGMMSCDPTNLITQAPEL